MNIEDFRKYCLSLPAAEESMPFDDRILVFKVKGKIFALCDIEEYEGFSVKCDPEWAVTLREDYPNHIHGAYHMNKKHWNSIRCDGFLPSPFIKKLILHSYELVVSKLPKKHRDTLIK